MCHFLLNAGFYCKIDENSDNISYGDVFVMFFVNIGQTVSSNKYIFELFFSTYFPAQ